MICVDINVRVLSDSNSVVRLMSASHIHTSTQSQSIQRDIQPLNGKAGSNEKKKK